MTYRFVRDSQSRVVRFGLTCFQMIDGVKCHAFVPAKKRGNILTIDSILTYAIDSDGNSVCGDYKIVSIGVGKIANVICIKL